MSLLTIRRATRQTQELATLTVATVATLDTPAPPSVARVATVAVARAEKLNRQAAAPSAPTCAGCRHFGRRRTCLEPVAAGLLTETEGFGIVWPPEGHGASCPAYISKTPTAAADRPYKLTQAEGDAAPAEPWDDAAIGRFEARVALLMRRGFSDDDADALAERLHLRDVQMDDRRLCLECIHLAGRAGAWQCGKHRTARVMRELPDELATRLQRCPGFTLAPGLA